MASQTSEPIEQIARGLAALGCKSAFGVTGSGPSLQLIHALELAGTTYYPATHEASAAIMAGVVSAQTQTPGVAITIKGPGFANLLPGLTANHFEAYPSVTISEAYDGDVPRTRMHKRLDHAAMASAVVKIHSGIEQAAQRLPELWAAARAEVPGPLHVDLGRNAGLPEYAAHPPKEIDDDAVDRLLEQIKAAQRVSVILGSWALRSEWRQRLAEARVPVFTTVAGRGAIDEGLAHAAGVYTGAGRSNAPEKLLAQSDLVVGIGLRTTEMLGTEPITNRAHVVDAAGPGHAQGFAEDVVTVDNEGNAMSRVLDAIAGAASWGVAEIAQLKDAMRSDPLLQGWLPAACFEIIDALTYDHALVLDTGSFCTVGEHIWSARRGRIFLGSSNGRYMGTAIPAAIGLALSHKNLPVICAVGDGGMAMYSAELRLAVAERLPLCVILMTDGLFGSVACASPTAAKSPRAVTISEPSWWRAVEGWGVQVEAVTSASGFESALAAWNKSTPLFIEAPFDPERYAVMTRNLR